VLTFHYLNMYNGPGGSYSGGAPGGLGGAPGGGGKPKGFGFSGFAIQPRRTGPETQLAQMGYGLSGGPMMRGGGTTHGYSSHIGKRRVRSEEE